MSIDNKQGTCMSIDDKQGTCMSIIGANGIVTRSLRKNLEAVPGKHSIDSLQKTAILGTSHIIQKVLQCEG
jgi:hypothetical protein